VAAFEVGVCRVGPAAGELGASPLAGGNGGTSWFGTSARKSGRYSQQLLQGEGDKLSGQIFLPILFYRWRKKILFFKIRGKSGKAEDNAKDVALKGKVEK